MVGGQSINYLIEALFSEADDTPLVLPYYNSASPSQPFSGPGGAGAAQNTRRAQRVSLQLKAGVAAPTGTQATPAVDAGWAPLYIVTVNFGETVTVPGDIAVYPGAPFVNFKLPTLRPGFISYGLVAVVPGTYTYTVPPGVRRLRVTITGGGGGGGGCNGNQSGGGGGAGATTIQYVDVTQPTYQYVVGSNGFGGDQTGSDGTAGGSSSFGLATATGGQAGQGGTNGSAGGYAGIPYPDEAATGLGIFGGVGSDGCQVNSTFGGTGGGSFWGSGARGTPSDITQEYAAAYGAGGGGAYGPAHFGGGGQVGVVVIEI